MEVVVADFRLGWTQTLAEARLVVERCDARRRSALTLAFVPTGSRVAVRMFFPVIGRAIDVSNQPGVLPTALSTDPPVEGAIAAVGTWLADLSATVGAWQPPQVTDPMTLMALLGAASFPMLGAAYRAGAGPAEAVPAWAAGTLTQSTARAAAVSAFGSKATRPVIAALASSLAGGQWVSLVPLGLALMGLPVLEPDQLVRLLRCHPVGHLPIPTVEQIRRGQMMMRALGARRAERVLTGGAGAPLRLYETAAMFADVGRLISEAPASTLDDLYEQCLRHMAHHPAPSPVPPSAPRPARPHPPPAQVAAFRRAALNAPAVTGCSSSGAEVLRFPADVRAQDKVEVNGMRIVLPRTTAELDTWGRLLCNCIGTYKAAAATGASLLIGIEEANRLAYCLELSPKRTVRQFLGSRNRPVPPPVAAGIIGHLARTGVVDVAQPANRRWLHTNKAGLHR